MGPFVHLEKCGLHQLLKHLKWRGKKWRVWEEPVGAATAGNKRCATCIHHGDPGLSVTGLINKIPDNPTFGDLLINTSFLGL